MKHILVIAAALLTLCTVCWSLPTMPEDGASLDDFIRDLQMKSSNSSKSNATNMDECKKWEAENKANKAVAKALESEVNFADNSAELSSSGKATLDKVAVIVKQYPWMEIAVEAHSDACIENKCASDNERKNVCAKLTAGRAKSTEDYLKSQGVKNPMTEPLGKCDVKRAVKITSPGGSKAKPAKCNEATTPAPKGATPANNNSNATSAPTGAGNSTAAPTGAADSKRVIEGVKVQSREKFDAKLFTKELAKALNVSEDRLKITRTKITPNANNASNTTHDVELTLEVEAKEAGTSNADADEVEDRLYKLAKTQHKLAKNTWPDGLKTFKITALPTTNPPVHTPVPATDSPTSDAATMQAGLLLSFGLATLAAFNA